MVECLSDSKSYIKSHHCVCHMIDQKLEFKTQISYMHDNYIELNIVVKRADARLWIFLRKSCQQSNHPTTYDF